MLSHDHVTTLYEQHNNPLDHSVLNLPVDISQLDLDFDTIDSDWTLLRPGSDLTQPHWMPAHHAATSSDFYSFSHQQQVNNPREWQYNNNVFSPYAQSHTSPQHRQHRRALSNSTVTSQASASPQSLPVAQLHAQAHAQALDGAQYRYLNSSYYPTPSHTPDYMERNRRRDVKPPTNMRSSSQMYDQNYGMLDDEDDLTTAPIIPRLEPSMTQACADELYAPSVGAPAQYTNPNPNQNFLQPQLQERVNAAVEARSRSPDLKREASPYREGSRFAMDIPQGIVQTAAQQRQQQKLAHDQEQQWRHQTRGEDRQEQKTISPKDAYVDDFHDPAEDAVVGQPLFQQQLFDDSLRFGRYQNTSFSFQAPSIPAATPPEMKYASLQRQSSGEDTPAMLSLETSRSDHSTASTPSLPPPRTPQSARPSHLSDTSSGTYSCTYAGCPQRFATPALLQKHKRDIHRSTVGSRHSTTSPRPGEPSSSSTPTSIPTSNPHSDSLLDRNSQAGPHRCDRINPSTGKPCNTIFSRPYDLTRHEDTIHARRPKVSCQYCAENGEEKTFSRADALTRHLRVVHPDIEQYGKTGRRRG